MSQQPTPDNNLDAKKLSKEMQKAYNLALGLHAQGKGFQSILASLGENTSLDFDERLEVMDLLEAEGNKVIVSNNLIWGTLIGLVLGLTLGIIFIAAGIWLMFEEKHGGFVGVIRGTQIRIFWVSIASGIFIILFSIFLSAFEAFKLYRASAKR